MTDSEEAAIRRLSLVRPPAGEPPIEASRPQDVGRRHRRKGTPSPETAQLLTRYREAMRGELEAVLGELALAPAPKGDAQLMLDGKPADAKRPALETRMRLWDLGIKLGRELGTEIDPGPSPTATTQHAGPRRGRGRVDYGGR